MMDQDRYDGYFFRSQTQGLHTHFPFPGTPQVHVTSPGEISLGASGFFWVCPKTVAWRYDGDLVPVFAHRLSLHIFSVVSSVPVGTLDVGGSTMSVMSICSPAAVASWQVPFPGHGSVTKSHTVELHQSRQQVRRAVKLLGWSQD